MLPDKLISSVFTSQSVPVTKGGRFFFFQIFFSLALCHTKKTKVNFCTLSLLQHNKDSSRYPQMLQLNTQNG